MVTNYPQQLAATTEHAQHAITAEAGVMARMATRLGQVFCGLGGHDAVLHFEGKRVMMRCTSCGHDTPGWEIDDRAPRRRFEGDATRHLLMPNRRLVLKKSA
jgi:hypothetical protein